MKFSSTSVWVSAGRILLALLFVVSGLAKYASTHVQTAGYVVSDGFPLDTAAAWILGTLDVFLGVCLALGYRLRLVAFVAVLYVLVSSFAFHAFWAVEPQEQFAQQLLFMKSLSLIGGLLLVAGATGAAGVKPAD